ncbi:CPBP family intramembrane glutamic endopeptidase [Nocardioides marmoribigeumensis]|uniref:Membrane protease YdiL (CAAX protease family) n=1 Tax=Nocardioides marmoribigeumensis TaxID=433649 RepID=A0ABU2BTB2_9ACTN|nr:CPBP family glutamic-type intramembrane protease [Nocardioides marmoribigeumensis]MDR7361511.1 membrane protease YdiL (CAAX protease family) [Nocardioides marmoribigeumensis]
MTQPPGPDARPPYSQDPYATPPGALGPVPPYAGPPGDWHRYTRPPEQRPTFQHAEPMPYHLMLRTWTYAWWRPVVGLLLLLAGMLVVVPVVMIPVLLVGTAIESGATDAQQYGDAVTAALGLKEVTVSGLLWLNLVLGAMVLWTWMLIRVLHQLRPRWLASVRPRIRWKFFFACLGLSVLALVAQVVVGAVVPAGDTGMGGDLNPITGKTIALIVVVLLTTPLQAAGEEYVFRGYLLQAVGALSKRAWVAVLGSAVLFAMAHGLQNPPLFFDRFMFGLIAAWLVIRTGGLEAGIALHVLNNLLAFGGAILLGDVSDMLNVSEISWWNIPVTLTQSAVYVVLVLLVARRMGLDDRTRPPAPQVAQATVGA